MIGRWRLLAWTAALALGLRGLHALGAGPLGVPLSSADDLSAWLDRTPPEVMAVAIVRLVAVAAGWYLAVCTLALTLTRPVGPSRAASAAARATPAIVRRLVVGAGGIGLTAGTVVGALSSTMVAPAPLAARPAAASIVRAMEDPGPPTATMTHGPRDMPTAVMTRLPAEDTPTAVMTRLPAEDTPTAVMTRVPAEDAPPTTVTTRLPGTDAPRASRSPPARATRDPSAAPPSWTVETGDSFWSIAAETLAEAGETPTDGRVIGYWRRLVEANRGRLLDPDNPDLLVPGQELVLPDPRG
jgi:LysM domain